MDTFIQPKITGYRQLSEKDAELMNEIKAHGVALGKLVDRLSSRCDINQRWLDIGTTDLQTGLMALTRAVARPSTF